MSTTPSASTAAVDEDIAHAIGVEGYTFLYRLLLMETTRQQMTNVASPGESAGRGPADVFVNVRAFPPADFRDVVRPNFNTLYPKPEVLDGGWVPPSVTRSSEG